MSWPSAKGDIRLNNAYGQLLLRRGLFARAEGYFRTAIQRLTWKNPNPYDSEPYYNLGLALWYQGKEDEAYDAFFKATWTAAQQEMSFYDLAAIACRRGEWDLALAHVERSLVKNGRNLKAIALKGLILAKQNRPEEARKWLASQLEQDPFDYVSRFLLEELEDCGHQQLLQLMGSRVSSFVEGAIDLLDGGFARLAGRYLDLCPGSSPMLYYYRALGEEQAARARFHKLVDYGEAHLFDEVSFDYFAVSLPDLLLFQEDLTVRNQGHCHFLIGLGCLGLGELDRACESFRRTLEIDPSHQGALLQLRHMEG